MGIKRITKMPEEVVLGSPIEVFANMDVKSTVPRSI